jgi:hypothetical protein
MKRNLPPYLGPDFCMTCQQWEPCPCQIAALRRSRNAWRGCAVFGFLVVVCLTALLWRLKP